MADNGGLKAYYKYLVFIVLFGFAGTVWGGFTYFIGIPAAYLNFLGASSTQISLLNALFWGGFGISGVLAAYKSESLVIKKRYISLYIFLSSIGFLLAGLYILITGATNQTLSIWIFLVFFAWAAIIVNFYIPANFALLFKIIPTARLGQLLGIMFSVMYLGSFISGFAMSAINKIEAPMNYAVLFLCTFVCTVIASLLMLTLPEPEGEPVKSAPSFGAFLGKLINTYKTDKLFGKFIIGKWLMTGHYVMFAFLITYLIKQRGFAEANAGWFPALNALGLFIGGFTITKIADAYGPKYLLISSQIIAIIYTLLVWLVPSTSIVIVFVAFAITGLAQISDNVGYTNMTLFCCPSLDKSTYVAAINIAIVLPMVLVPILMGKLMDWGVLTFNGTFTVALLLMVAAIIYIMTVIENPKAFVDMKAAASKS